jgi:hypothetical protein
MNHSIDDIKSPRHANQLSASGATQGKPQKRTSSYLKLLEGPVSNIAGNVPERSDATNVAILGYN